MKVIEIKVYKYTELKKEIQEKVICETIDFIIQVTDFENLDKHSNLYKAYKKANDLQTIWFLGSYIWEMAESYVLDMAKQNWYFENGEIANNFIKE